MKPISWLTFLSLLCLPALSPAVVVSTPKSLETLVKNGGSNSVWVSDGEVKNLETSTNAAGMEIVTLTIEGKVLKGPMSGYVHPAFGAWVTAGAEPQTFKVMMLNSEKYPELRNLIAIPKVGSRLTACFTAPSPKSKLGVSSPCGGQENGLFMESLNQGETVLSNAGANKALGIKGLAPNGGGESYGKALQAVKSRGDDSVPKESFNQILQQLVRQYHPAKPAENPAKAKVESPPLSNGTEEIPKAETPENSPEEIIRDNDATEEE